MIVDKINAYLATEGREVDYAILKEVADLAAQAFEHQFGFREEKAQNAPYFSSIGKCLRQQAYKLLDFTPNGKEVDSRSKMVFFQGDMAELAIIQIAKQAGCNITACGGAQETIEVDGMRGRPDGILHADQDYVVEIKSMSSFSFRDFERGIIDDHYRMQCTAGMVALNLDKCVIVGLNKDAGVLYEMVISKDPEIVRDLQERLETLKKCSKEDLPPRPYSPDEKGFYPWQCLYCAFWRTCLPNAQQVLVSGKYKLKEIKNAPTPA